LEESVGLTRDWAGPFRGFVRRKESGGNSKGCKGGTVVGFASFLMLWKLEGNLLLSGTKETRGQRVK